MTSEGQDIASEPEKMRSAIMKRAVDFEAHSLRASHTIGDTRYKSEPSFRRTRSIERAVDHEETPTRSEPSATRNRRKKRAG